MKTRVFKNGDSQAVRIPKQFRFACDEVVIKKHGRSIVLSPVAQDSFSVMFDVAGTFSNDFMSERDQPPMQKRAGL